MTTSWSDSPSPIVRAIEAYAAGKSFEQFARHERRIGGLDKVMARIVYEHVASNHGAAA